jgi:hypothetical protein
MPHLGSITSEYDANEEKACAIEAVEKFCPPIAVSPDVKMKLILSSEINQRQNIVNTDGPTYNNSISNKHPTLSQRRGSTCLPNIPHWFLRLNGTITVPSKIAWLISNKRKKSGDTSSVHGFLRNKVTILTIALN